MASVTAPSPYALFILHSRWAPMAAATCLRRFAPGVYRPGVPRLAVAHLSPGEEERPPGRASVSARPSVTDQPPGAAT
eukprot:785832-Prymnesium_polylepis.1